jgi:hypothetical protein
MHNNIIFHALLNNGWARRPDLNRCEPCRSPAVKQARCPFGSPHSAHKKRGALQDRRATPDYTGG